MAAKILGGKQIAEAIKAEIKAEIADLGEVHGFRPCLAVVRVGDDPASAVYVGNKVKTSEELGLAVDSPSSSLRKPSTPSCRSSSGA
jgi:methylenetetrahydrofolate dehydrogenase (NADP+)/methenyltetrahydrofolate cyclohydrolase